MLQLLSTPPESPQEVQIYTKIESPTESKLVETGPRPQSIYIAPSVGCEVIWDPDEQAVCEYEPNDPEPSNEDDDVEDVEEINPLHRSENCLASCVNLESVNEPRTFKLSPVKNLRRVSSLSDVSKFLVPKNRKSTTVYGFNPRAGITIPKIPDTAKRRAGRSRVARTSSNCSSQSSIASSVASSISSVSKIPKVKPDIVRFGPISSGSRVGVSTFSYPKDRQTRAEKRTLPVNTNTYVSFAQAVASFQKNTPTRYRTAPRGGIPKRSISVETTKRRPSPVSPHSPKLMTKQRARQTISNAQNELKKEESKLPVKAQQPLNHKLLRGPMLTLPKKIELKTTKPQPFNLTEHSRPKVTTEETIEWRFKARPAPVKILHGSIGVKERQLIKPTAPVEMHFASEDRIRERQQKRNAQSKEPSPVRQIIPPKTSRVPQRRAPSPMRPVEHKTTSVLAFSFEQRYKEIKKKKAEKLKQEEQETKKQREFHANPLPSFSSKLPKRKAVEPTHVEPFRFMSDERGAAHQAALRQKLEDEERNLKEQQKFHANPAIVVKKKPFEPAKSSRPLVEPLDIQLNSDVRAQEREKFDGEIKVKEQELEERRLQAANEERGREYELQLRQQLVHKAKPFKNPRVFEVKASGKPLVDPKSPDFTLLPSQRRPKRLDSP